MLTWINRAGL